MNDWVTKALGKDPKEVLKGTENNGLRVAPPEEEFVILLQGKNKSGDRIYSYLKMQVRHLPNLQDAIVNKKDFTPSDFGEVVAAGLGDPSAELRSEMAVTYDLVDLAPKGTGSKTPNLSQPTPSIWDEED